MAELISIYGFIAVLLRGLSLSLEAVTVGGIIFLVAIRPGDPKVELRCRQFLRGFAIGLAIVAICGVISSSLILLVTGGGDPYSTSFFRAAVLAVAGAAIIAIFARRGRIVWLIAPAAAIVAAALLTSHAYARMETRPLLLTFTGLHHVATAAWIGALPYLLISLTRGSKDQAISIAQRFSKLAVASVAALVAGGLGLAWIYVANPAGMYATSYGVMLAAKIVLLALLLGLGGTNFILLRRKWMDPLLPVLRSVEVEAALGIAAILTAASLTSQPPATDLTEDRATPAEIAARLAPRLPSLHTPPLESLSPATPLSQEEAQRFGRPVSYTPGTKYSPDKPEDIAWSEYNHHWAGICVLAIGVFALIAQASWGRWARHWPLVFFGLAIFLLIRGDSENWPLGPRGFWESFQVAEVAQHRVFVALIVAFAIFEWRVATGRSERRWHAFVFPAICMIGGALLLTHTHSLGNIKQELLAEMSHTPIALFAITAAGSRWLQLRLPQKPAFLGPVWGASFVCIGLMLIFYREI